MRSSLNDESWRLQARLAAMSDWIAATPGICNGGRALACDDLDALGWRRVGEILERDGVLTFRFLPVESRNHVLLSTEPAWRGFHDEMRRFLHSGDPAPASRTAAEAGLTPAEASVLALVARGLDNRAIAATLGKSEKTVRNQFSAILDKLGVKSRAEAIVRALAD